jgi:hypothetical protein
MTMVEKRDFTSTTLLASYGYIFWTLNDKGNAEIGFMRRPQPEIHHGDPFPYVMATVGGMRDISKVLDENEGPNAEGFMGRPPSNDEVAQMQVGIKLGAIMTTINGEHLEGWLDVTHPFYYGEKTPQVRNVGTVFRKPRFVEENQRDRLQNILQRRNAASKPEHVHELNFFERRGLFDTVLANDRGHSMKSGEIDLVDALYDLLPNSRRIGAEFLPLAQYR